MSETTTSDTVPGTRRVRAQHGFWFDLFARLTKTKPLGVVGMVIVVLLFLTGIFAPLLAPEGYNATHLEVRLSPPSPQYPLGTDEVGRDMLSRVIWGARISMIVGVVATALHTLISTTIGMLSAFIGGKFDLIVQRFVDAWICFPQLVILITLMSIIGPGLITILLVLGVSSGISAIRFNRALALAIKESMYMQASQAIGANTGRVLWHHLLPNIMPMVITLFSTAMGGVILAEASLSFLGLGLPPPMPSWGGMLSGTGRQYMLRAPWLMFWPGLVLSLVVFGINMLGDAMRDLLDPRLRGGVGGYNLGRIGKMKQKIFSKTGREV